MAEDDAPLADAAAVPPLVIFGATNMVAGFLLERLGEAPQRPVVGVARRAVDARPGVEAVRLDVLSDEPWRVPAGAEVVSILPLSVLAKILPRIEGAGSVVAVGSTSLFGKALSGSAKDRATVARLAAAEAGLARWCGVRRIPWTVLRPTLVYDGRRDRNIARMASVIRRFGVLPIARPASGLRQPIHAADVAGAILGALGNPAARDRAFDVAGGEILTYRAMAERVFEAVGRRPRFVPLPVGLLEGVWRAGTASGLLRSGGVGPSMFRRMNQDLVYDTEPGLRVLGYAPRPFTLPDLR